MAQSYWSKLGQSLVQNRLLYLLALPGLIFFLVFRYGPIWGLTIAFQDFDPFSGWFGSPWIGFENFIRFFQDQEFFNLFRNTLAISFINLFLFFPLPIILALMLNELRSQGLKKSIQTLVYLPHFFSWVIIYQLTAMLFSQESGVINGLVQNLGGKPIDVMTNESFYWFTLAFQAIWKDAGWGTILFLAAMAGVNVELYEAAKMDGASRFKQMLHITLPTIGPVIVVLFILRLGNIMEVGFEQNFLMQNGAVSNVADVFDLFAYRMGLQQGQFSFATAVGLFKSMVGLVLIVGTNKLAKKFGHDGIY